jgi:hypothetical protein
VEECKPLPHGIKLVSTDCTNLLFAIADVFSKTMWGLYGRALQSLTSKLNLRTFGNASLTSELNLSTLRTHPRVNSGYVVDKVSLS